MAIILSFHATGADGLVEKWQFEWDIRKPSRVIEHDSLLSSPFQAAYGCPVRTVD